MPLTIIGLILGGILATGFLWWKPTYEGFILAGRQALAKGDYDTAQAKFERALGLNPFSGEARGDLGIALKRQQKDERAIWELSFATVLLFDTKEVRLTRATAYFTAGKLAQAEADLKVALAKDPNYAFANYWLARVLSATNRYDEAVTFAKKAAEEDPRMSDAVDKISPTSSK